MVRSRLNLTFCSMGSDYFLNRDRIQTQYNIVSSNHPDAQQKPGKATGIFGKECALTAIT